MYSDFKRSKISFIFYKATGEFIGEYDTYDPEIGSGFFQIPTDNNVVNAVKKILNFRSTEQQKEILSKDEPLFYVYNNVINRSSITDTLTENHNLFVISIKPFNNYHDKHFDVNAIGSINILHRIYELEDNPFDKKSKFFKNCAAMYRSNSYYHSKLNELRELNAHSKEENIHIALAYMYDVNYNSLADEKPSVVSSIYGKDIVS